jgi:redox-sensitive bicupin YhaK (pirin superfamily)
MSSAAYSFRCKFEQTIVAMKKEIAIRYGGKNSYVGELLVNRLLPNEQVFGVGPIMFLDHIYPTFLDRKDTESPRNNAHPHRGIATFSYLFEGALAHSDSRGNSGVVEAGGVQWMKAGNGILHDEQPASRFFEQGGTLHSLQFWINLPAVVKAEDPEYQQVGSKDIPEGILPDAAGSIRVLLGSCGEYTSPVKTFNNEFIYHIKLNPKSTFTYSTKANLEYGVFIPSSEVFVNGEIFGKSQLLVFTKEGGEIELSNPGIHPADVILFGGEPYLEPVVAEGPFVMNTRQEIAGAYSDFFSGKYGEIPAEVRL